MAREMTHEDIMDLYRKYNDSWKERYAAGAEDFLFVSGEGQWPTNIKNDREKDGRPCLTINKMVKFVNSVAGDMMQNKTEAKVYPVDSKGDVALAEVFQDVIRHIEYKSDADAVYSTGGTQMLAGSIGFWRILSEYEDAKSFDQGLRVRKVRNPFSVLMDPDAKNPNYTDARGCFIIDRMPKAAFEEAYPGHAPSNFNSDETHTALHEWFTDEYVRIAEFYYFKKKTRNLVLTTDGQVLELTGEITKEFLKKQDVEIVDEREAEEDVLCWVKMSGTEFLEGPEEQPGKFIPVIACPGNELDVQGKPMMFSLIRHSKDSQRMYNYFHSASVETQALQPQAPFLMTAKQVKGHEKMWAEYPRRKRTHLLYNYDPLAGKPDRLSPPTTDTGAFSEMNRLDEEIYDTIGVARPSLGQPSNERSGKALILRQRASDKAIFSFFDNHARAIAHTARILVDLIPHYYDTERIIRIMGDDGKVRELVLNKVERDEDTAQDVIYNDLSDAGQYDVVCKAGPSYETKRQQTADALMQFLQFAPNYAPLIAPAIAKNLDAPGMAELAEMLIKVSPPEIQAILGGGTLPPEGMPGTPGPMGPPGPEQAPSPMG